LRKLLQAELIRQAQLNSELPVARVQLSNVICYFDEFATVFGYMGLLLVFFIEKLQPLSWKMSTRLSILLPLQGCILFGLSGDDDWPDGHELKSFLSLRWLFKRLDWVGKYSYSQYTVQFICYNLWPERIVDWTFWIFLTSMAVLYETLGTFIQHAWRKKVKLQFSSMAVFVLLISALSLVDFSTIDSYYEWELPIVFRHKDGKSVDMRLTLNPTDLRDASGRVVINPSIAFLDHGDEMEFIVVGREHGRSSVQTLDTYEGKSVTRIDQIWHSRILSGSTLLAKSQIHSWLTTGTSNGVSLDLFALKTITSDGSAWNDLCTRDTYIPANNTLIRTIVTGPEDPRLTLVDEELVLSFNSILPVDKNSGCPEVVVSQMFITPFGTGWRKHDPLSPKRLEYGWTRIHEKNWVGFSYEGDMYFVYQIFPHTIVRAQSHSGEAERLYETSFGDFITLTRNLGDHIQGSLRGSASAVRIEGNQRTTPHLPRAHYLGLFHAQSTEGEYLHFAYRFSPSPPFEVLQVSRQLPLLGRPSSTSRHPFAFATGLAVVDDVVLLTYGSGDQESRLLVMELSEFDEYFC